MPVYFLFYRIFIYLRVDSIDFAPPPERKPTLCVPIGSCVQKVNDAIVQASVKIGAAFSFGYITMVIVADDGRGGEVKRQMKENKKSRCDCESSSWDGCCWLFARLIIELRCVSATVVVI